MVMMVNGPAAGFDARPRRDERHLLTPAEVAIRAAIDVVQKLGADQDIADAVILLHQASNKVSDYIDRKLSGT